MFITLLIDQSNSFMKVFVHRNVPGREIFIESLQSQGVDVCGQEDQFIEWNRVRAAVVWRDIPEEVRNLASLELLMTCGSGVDHLSFHGIAKSVRIVRLVDHGLRLRVANYVKDCLDSFFLSNSNIAKPKVGILGLGLVGGAVADVLLNSSYDVSGWARTPQLGKSFPVYTGSDGLYTMARISEAIVCILPLTKDTTGILNQKLFKAMPANSFLINVGRGEHLSARELLSSLERNRIKRVRLDVWSDYGEEICEKLRNLEMVEITPHIAGGIEPVQQANYANYVLKSLASGMSLEGTVCVEQGY